MISRMATVSPAKAEKMMERPKKPPPLREDRPRCITMDQSTSESSATKGRLTSERYFGIASNSQKKKEGGFPSLFPPANLPPLTCVGQAEGPESQVRSRVGDAAKTVLYGVDGLVDCYIAKVKLKQKKNNKKTTTHVIISRFLMLI